MSEYDDYGIVNEVARSLSADEYECSVAILRTLRRAVPRLREPPEPKTPWATCADCGADYRRRGLIVRCPECTAKRERSYQAAHKRQWRREKRDARTLPMV